MKTIESLQVEVSTLFDGKDLPKLEVVNVNPGDIILIKTEHILSMNQIEKIADQMKIIFPRNSCVILDNGLTIEVYRENKK